MDVFEVQVLRVNPSIKNKKESAKFVRCTYVGKQVEKWRVLHIHQKSKSMESRVVVRSIQPKPHDGEAFKEQA